MAPSKLQSSQVFDDLILVDLNFLVTKGTKTNMVVVVVVVTFRNFSPRRG